ncbi:guanine nucleotide binding protein, alpha subunit [Infundibulicybe gibba]|nr:guanine nucleotide binding protein, alpha subunit [Infundibulicybe gibba]
MGSRTSTAKRAAKARSNVINKQIEEDSEKYERECEILLLGSSGSGKSTILKQMKIIYQNGFSDAELTGFQSIIYRNLLDSAQSVIAHMRKIGLECIDDDNHLAEKILNFRLEPLDHAHFPEIVDAIHQLWENPIILELMNGEFGDIYLMDNARYFFEEALCIGTSSYLPNNADILRARHKNQGFTEARFTIGSLSIRLFDISSLERSGRKKWMHRFEGVTSIIFCVALGEYDRVEFSENRMVDSLGLFESVTNSRWFRQPSIVLFLNKIDVFKKKIKAVPLGRCFPEYTGGTDAHEAIRYIIWRFMQTNRRQLSIYPYLTNATHTLDIRLIFDAVKETILENVLKDSGIL